MNRIFLSFKDSTQKTLRRRTLDRPREKRSRSKWGSKAFGSIFVSPSPSLSPFLFIASLNGMAAGVCSGGIWKPYWLLFKGWPWMWMLLWSAERAVAAWCDAAVALFFHQPSSSPPSISFGGKLLWSGNGRGNWNVRSRKERTNDAAFYQFVQGIN